MIVKKVKKQSYKPRLKQLYTLIIEAITTEIRRKENGTSYRNSVNQSGIC